MRLNPLWRILLALFTENLPYEPVIRLAAEISDIRNVEKKSHSIDSAYLRWQRVRMHGIPLNKNSRNNVTCKTGFEGYFVGKVYSKEELFDELLQIGKNVWENMKRLYRLDNIQLRELEQTICGTKPYTLAAITEWSSVLGAQIARLRMNLLNNPQAIHFQSETKLAVAGLPKITYEKTGTGKIVHKFKMPVLSEPVSFLNCSGLTEEQQFYWTIVSNLGKFGHPLLRTALQELYYCSASARFMPKR